MKINIFKPIVNNTGKLEKTRSTIIIKRGKWEKETISHPMKFERVKCFDKYTYFLHSFGDDSKSPHHGVHISLSFFENIRFLWLQNSHWLQKEENLRYVINLIFLTLGLILGFMKLH